MNLPFKDAMGALAVAMAHAAGCITSILPRDSGEGGPPEGWWKGRLR
jgi:hypothetical protein